MKNIFKRGLSILCVVSMISATAFAQTNEKSEVVSEDTPVIEKIDDSGLTDEEFDELEEKFDKFVEVSKEKKSFGYCGPKRSIPDSILKEEQNEIEPYAGEDDEEVEPNNRMADADRIYVDDYMYGTIEDGRDVDYYKVKFSRSGQGYFRLSDVPDGEDYELYVMGSGGTMIEEGTAGTDGETERVYAFVTPDIYYYIRVEGCSDRDYDDTNQYCVRVKLYDDEEEYAISVGAEYDGFGEDEIDTSDDAINAHNIFDEIGYNSEFCIVPSYNYLNGENPNGTDRLGSSIVFLDGHGEFDHIRFESFRLQGTNDEQYNTGVSTKEKEVSGDNESEYVSIKSKNVEDTRLMIFSACYTAEPNDEYNLTEYAVRRGAETAIGWRDRISEQASADWNERFLKKLSIGYSVEEAAEYADEIFSSSSSILDWVIEGNEANVINLSGPYSYADKKTLRNSSDIAEDVYIDINDLSSLNNIIKDTYDYFDEDEYEITIKPVNDTTYRIFYEKFINGFNTNSGFYVVIKDNMLYYIKEKIAEIPEKLFKVQPNLNNEIIENDKSLAAEEIPEQYHIVNQDVNKVIVDGKYCLIVETEYSVGYGTDSEAYSCREYIYEL